METVEWWWPIKINLIIFLIGDQNLMILNLFLELLLIGKKKLNDTENILDLFKLIFVC